jgi:hypothetical protein
MSGIAEPGELLIVQGFNSVSETKRRLRGVVGVRESSTLGGFAV